MSYTLNDRTGSQMNLAFDNDALYKICSNQLKIENPCLRDINLLIAQYAATFTSQMRFGGSDMPTLRTWLTSLVPYPRIMLLTPSFAPFTPADKEHQDDLSVKDLLLQGFNSAYFLNSGVPNSDNIDKSFSTQITFQGDVPQSSLLLATQFLKANR